MSERLTRLLAGCIGLILALAATPLAFERSAASAQLQPVIASPGRTQSVELLQTIQFLPWELVTALTWSPDQAWLIVSAGNRLVGYQTETWQAAWEFPMPALSASLAFSPDGRWLAAGSRDGLVRVWAAKSLSLAGVAEPTLVIKAHKKGVNNVAFDPDSSFLASGGNDAMVRFWDPNTGDSLGQMIGGTYAVPSFAFSPDGKELAVVNGTEVRLREVSSERITGAIRASHPLYSLAFHPQENFFVTGSTENQVELWDAGQAFRTGQERYPEPLRFDGHNGISHTYRALVWQVAFNPQGSLFASAGGDAFVRIWDYEQKNQAIALSGHRLAVSSVSFSPDGCLLASGSLDASVRIWQVKTP